MNALLQRWPTSQVRNSIFTAQAPQNIDFKSTTESVSLYDYKNMRYKNQIVSTSRQAPPPNQKTHHIEFNHQQCNANIANAPQKENDQIDLEYFRK